MWKRGLIAGFINLVLSFGLNALMNALVPQIMAQYQNTAIFRPWQDPLMMIYLAYPFILGVAAAYLWQKLNRPKPIELVKTYLIIATIPGMFITYTCFQVSLLMIASWTVSGLVQVYVAGLVFEKIKK